MAEPWDPCRGATTVELVIATPLMLLLLMLVVQFAVWAHAEHVAQAAANTGVQTARAYRATPDQGRADAVTVLANSAGTVLTGVQVTAGRDATTATVTVIGQAMTVVPGLHLPVRASVTAPRELVPGTP
jgi:Flp pilus assembly protein TadG